MNINDDRDTQREITKIKRAEESQEQPENFRLAFRYSPVDDLMTGTPGNKQYK